MTTSVWAVSPLVNAIAHIHRRHLLLLLVPGSKAAIILHMYECVDFVTVKMTLYATVVVVVISNRCVFGLLLKVACDGQD